MPAFNYQVIDRAGKRQRGTSDAASSTALVRSFESRGMLVITVEERAAAADGPTFRPGRKREVLEVTRAMAALLPAGMPLVAALNAAGNVAGDELTVTLRSVRAQVERGDSLAGALAEHPRLFPPLYIGLIRAGERSGRLDESFQRLATQLERDDAMRSKLLSAMIYPLMLGCVGTIAVTVLLVFVLPRFAELLTGSGATLPTSTATVLAVSAAARRFWPVLAMIPVAGFALFSWTQKTEEGRRAASKAMLAIPAVRTLRKYAIAARFARVVSVLLAGGAPLLTALDDAMDSITDPIAKEELSNVRQRVRDGVSLRQSVAESSLFPQLLPQLIGVGEDSGRLRDFLGKAADIFEEKTERAAQRLATLAEPAMIVGFGTIVAFVALSLLQAIYGINAASFK